VQELRTDEVTGTSAIVAPGRATRPFVFASASSGPSIPPPDCPFCPGHEAMTPPEVARTGAGTPDTPGWQVRVVPNLYPIVGAGGDVRELHGVHGAHEVIVCSPAHDKQLDALSLDDATSVFAVLRDRAAHHLDAGLVHAAPFVNSGRASGASIEHPHAQLVGVSFVPPLVETLLARFASAGRDLVADNIDAAADRGCLVRKARAVSWCPPGGSTPYVVRIALPSAGSCFDRSTDTDLEHFTEALQDTLARLHGTLGDFAYNVVVHTAPRGDSRAFHWWADVVPRIGVHGGFELETGVWVNPVAPEHAAATLRDA
jgi:UDPglucose--hexose-1-phosphate uridylyltransferase